MSDLCNRLIPNTMKVKEIMSSKLITLHPKDKIVRAKELFSEYKIHHIPIVKMEEIVGILSQGDVLNFSSKIHKIIRSYKELGEIKLNTVDEIMTASPICITGETEVHEAIQIMISKRINALPVVDDGKLVGLLTSFDLLKNLITK